MNIFHKVTLKSLKQNRTRTLVTIVGIILSTSMFTAVTTMVSSLSYSLIQHSIYTDGNWYGAGYGLSAKGKDALASNAKTKDAVSMELLGFAKTETPQDLTKPYLCVYGIQSDFTDMMPIHITQGRMPENNQEILLPEHLKTSRSIVCELEDTLSLALGNRMDSEGNLLSNQQAYLNSPYLTDGRSHTDHSDESAEIFTPSETRTYTVVGFYERPTFESYDAPGYTALTIGDDSIQHTYDLYLLTDSGKETVSLLQQMFEESETETSVINSSLLRLYGYSGESSYNQVLYNLAAILILIIMFGSVSLIYNAFSISVSERTRQFGLLSSIGATKRQLTGSVLFEALFLSIIGIPLGILSGLLGIGITLFFVQDMLASVLGFYNGNYTMTRISTLLGPAQENSLELHPSVWTIVIAAAVSLLTVTISAYLPARRATKKSAIDAIRQTEDISIRARKVKTSPLVEKLFGFEGMIATKNYKRNRRKYRATVISLFLSIVLFISASSFCAYLTYSTNSVLNDKGYDLSYYYHYELEESPDILQAKLSAAESVTDSTYSASVYFDTAVKTNTLSQNYRDYKKKERQELGEAYQENEYTAMPLYITFLADDAFRSYLKEQNLPEEVFFDKTAPKAVLLDSLRLYQENEHKFYRFPAFKESKNLNLSIFLTEIRDDYSYGGTYLDENNELYASLFYGDSAEETRLYQDECLQIPISVGASTETAPDFFSDSSNYVRLFYPYSMSDSVFSEMDETVSYYEISDAPLSETLTTELFFACEDHNTAYASMVNILVELNLSPNSLFNYAASEESDRAMGAVINIFSYGFIILISLIAAANVFNTISTNINLRRREFAMLRSIGMTPESFTKMMNFECLLYGFKGLLYGLPASFLVTWLIYRSILEGLEMAFFIPWYSIAIAVGSVFLVVFATMLYSMRKIRKENTIDALKNENL